MCVDLTDATTRAQWNRIKGALKNCIAAHGPITSDLIGSATKRIIEALHDTTATEGVKRKSAVLEETQDQPGKNESITGAVGTP